MKLQKYNFSIRGMGDIVGQESQGIGNFVCISGFYKIAQKIQKQDRGFSLKVSKSYTFYNTNHNPKVVLLYRNDYQDMNTLSCNVFPQPL